MAVALAQAGADCVLVARRKDDLAESTRAFSRGLARAACFGRMRGPAVEAR
jgi:NADP-dependent 3-hydroxy acid dehydrogenase YdfG